MAGCTNGDRVDEVRVGHVRQVEAVLMSCVRSGMMRDRVVFMEKFKKFKFQSSSEKANLTFSVIFFT